MLLSMISMYMKYSLLFMFVLTFFSIASGQDSAFNDSTLAFQKKYKTEHGVVKGADKSKIQFFLPDQKYLVEATVHKVYGGSWIPMETSGKVKKTYRIYAILSFRLNDAIYKLNAYQSQDLMATKEYEDHLFIPFLDVTSGEESYEAGRYIDLTIGDLKNTQYLLDFNRAYNPYCAYVSDVYNCPLPPKENHLTIAIRAGEKKYTKTGH